MSRCFARAAAACNGGPCLRLRIRLQGAEEPPGPRSSMISFLRRLTIRNMSPCPSRYVTDDGSPAEEELLRSAA